MAFLNMFASKMVGIDLGTSNSLVFVPHRDIILNEPSVVAITEDDNTLLAFGDEAREMIGKTPESIIAHRPLKDGVIADYRITEAMIRHFLTQASRMIQVRKTDVIVSVSAGITSTERRAVMQATKNAGASTVFTVQEPILAAIGAGVPVHSSTGSMIVDVGGGTTEVAIISLGGIVVSKSARVGGDKMDQAIISFVKSRYNVAIGEHTAENLKVVLGSATPQKREDSLEVRGRDLMTGLPKHITVHTNNITEAISGDVGEIVQTVKQVLRETPPELSSDIMERGILLSGGVAYLRNLSKLLSEVIGVPAFVVEDPMLSVVRGTGIAMENLEMYRRSIMNKR